MQIDQCSSRERLEYLLGKSCTVFSSQQRALETCLEALGGSLYTTPVVLSVNSPTWVVSAVIRSGCLPILLDTSNTGLSYNLKDLEDIINDQEELIILFYDHYSIGPDQEYLDLVKDKVSILLSPSFTTLDKEYIKKFTFTVCDMQTSITPPGGILYSPHQDTKSTILKIRDGVLGIGDYYPDDLASKFIGNYKLYISLCNNLVNTARELEVTLFNLGIDSFLGHFGTSCPTNTEWLPIYSSFAQKLLVDWQDLGIVCKLDLRPLHTFPEIGQRYQQPPSYPIAERLYNKILSIKVSQNSINKLKETLK